MRAFPVLPPSRRPTGPVIAFVATPSTETPVAGVDVTWTTNAADLGTPTSYTWDFGDGTIAGSGASIPAHFWVSTIAYTVTITVTMDDNSTYTDMVVITPTAPSASANMTQVELEAFTASRSSGALGTFDSWAGTGVTRTGPVGAKLAATDSVGWSAYSGNANWGGFWATINLYTDGFRQIGAWFYLEAYPSVANYILPVYWTAQGVYDGIRLYSDGSLKTTYPDTEVLKATVPLHTWFYLGMAAGGQSDVGGARVKCSYIYKEIGSAAEVLDANNMIGLYGLGNQAAVLGVGDFNESGNQQCGLRISYAQLHSLVALEDAAYPGDIVPPQDECHVYLVDPIGGDDANDGVTGAWETVGHLNDMLDGGTLHNGIFYSGTAGTEGSGCQVRIDTSVQPFDVGTEGILIFQDQIWLRPISGETTVEIAGWIEIDSSEWSETGGYTGIYEIACDQKDGGLWQDGIFHERSVSLAALDGLANGASWVDDAANKMYVKPYGGTDPRVDGKTYIRSRLRPADGVDTVGYPAVAFACADVRISGMIVHKTAFNNNGSYTIGDIDPFTGKALIEDCYCVGGDKHQICFTSSVSDSTIHILRCQCEQSYQQPFTSFQGSGTGNTHIYEDCTMLKAGLADRSSVGVGAALGFYSHGSAANNFDLIHLLNCNFADNDIGSEGAAILFKIDGSTVGYVHSLGSTQIINGSTLKHIPLLGETTKTTLLDSSTIQPVAVANSILKPLGGEVAITDNMIDLREFNGGSSSSVWSQGTDLELTFTGNVVRFANTDPYFPCPLFENMESANIISCNNNTYYIPAASTFAKQFDAGGGPADYTFAQWQALGYDAASTRLDPV